MVKSYKEQLEDHIKALEKGYDNTILLLNDDLDKNDKDEITLKDDKKKTFAEGVLKLAQTADQLIGMIRTKKEELEDLENAKKPQQEREQKIEQEKPKKASTRNLKDH